MDKVLLNYYFKLLISKYQFYNRKERYSIYIWDGGGDGGGGGGGLMYSAPNKQDT